eukprot:6149474-Pleurochrysis_carterae.AAC.5
MQVHINTAIGEVLGSAINFIRFSICLAKRVHFFLSFSLQAVAAEAQGSCIFANKVDCGARDASKDGARADE